MTYNIILYSINPRPLKNLGKGRYISMSKLDFFLLFFHDLSRKFSRYYQSIPDFGTFDEYMRYYDAIPSFEQRKREWVLEKTLGKACIYFEHFMMIANSSSNSITKREALRKAIEKIVIYSQYKKLLPVVLNVFGPVSDENRRLGEKGRECLELSKTEQTTKGR